MRRKLVVLPLLLALLLVAAFGTGLRCVVGTVTHVVDGDTIDVRADLPVGWGDDCPLVAGNVYRVRLIGVNTPEVYGQRQKGMCLTPRGLVHISSLTAFASRAFVSFST